ncbi:MAG TPA: tetratricopeptide repeat protein [Parasulfuritortus sp.]
MSSQFGHAQHAAALRQAQEHAEAGRLAEAEAIYRVLVAITPRFHPAFSAYGLFAIRAGRLAQAAELFEEALSLAPNEVLYCLNYGEACRRLGRFAEAVEVGTRACGLAPNDIDAHFNLALACSDANLSVRVEAIYQKVLELLEPAIAAGTATAAMWERRAFVLQRLGRLEEARRSHEQAMKLEPAASAPDYA